MTPFARALDDFEAASRTIRLLRRNRKGGLDVQIDLVIQRRFANEALARRSRRPRRLRRRIPHQTVHGGRPRVAAR